MEWDILEGLVDHPLHGEKEPDRYRCTHHVLGKTIQRGNHLAKSHGGILNNHVVRDEPSNRGIGLTSTHNRILNTCAPVT